MRQILRQVFLADWRKANFFGSLVRLIPVILGLFGVLVLKKVQPGLYWVTGAFIIGIGSLGKASEVSNLALAGASVVFGGFATLGACVGYSQIGVVLILFGLGFVYGFLSSQKAFLSWLSLASLIAFIVLGMPYPTSWRYAFIRGSLATLGGLLQVVILRAFRSWDKRFSVNLRLKSTDAPDLRWTRTEILHGLRVSLALVLGYSLCRVFAFPRSYWTLLTIAVVLQPRFQDTLIRGSARWFGTLLGAGLATLFELTARPGLLERSLLVAICALASFLFLNVNYGLFCIFITAYVVFLLGLVGLPELQIVEYRLLSTLLGGAIAILPHLITSIRPPSKFKKIRKA